MRDKTRDQILEAFQDQLKGMIKGLLEKLMLEERELYLEEHPTKGNGYYTRDLLTLFGPLEDLDERGLRRFLSLEGGYESWALRLIGVQNQSFVAERDGRLVGYLGVQTNRYQDIGTIRPPLLVEEEAYPGLLSAALRFFTRAGKRTAYVDLLDGQEALAPFLEGLGAKPERVSGCSSCAGSPEADQLPPGGTALPPLSQPPKLLV